MKSQRRFAIAVDIVIDDDTMIHRQAFLACDQIGSMSAYYIIEPVLYTLEIATRILELESEAHENAHIIHFGDFNAS